MEAVNTLNRRYLRSPPFRATRCHHKTLRPIARSYTAAIELPLTAQIIVAAVAACCEDNSCAIGILVERAADIAVLVFSLVRSEQAMINRGEAKTVLNGMPF